MSGFEHYDSELAKLDREIRHLAAVSGVDLSDRSAIKASLEAPPETWPVNKTKQSLRGLLFLRMKLESEMLGEGLLAPPLTDSLPLE